MKMAEANKKHLTITNDPEEISANEYLCSTFPGIFYCGLFCTTLPGVLLFRMGMVMISIGILTVWWYWKMIVHSDIAEYLQFCQSEGNANPIYHEFRELFNSFEKSHVDIFIVVNIHKDSGENSKPIFRISKKLRRSAFSIENATTYTCDAVAKFIDIFRNGEHGYHLKMNTSLRMDKDKNLTDLLDKELENLINDKHINKDFKTHFKSGFVECVSYGLNGEKRVFDKNVLSRVLLNNTGPGIFMHLGTYYIASFLVHYITYKFCFENFYTQRCRLTLAKRARLAPNEAGSSQSDLFEIQETEDLLTGRRRAPDTLEGLNHQV